MRPRTYAAIIGFILVCTVLTTLLRTIDRTFFGSTAKPTPTASQSSRVNPAPQPTGPSSASIRKQHRDALLAIERAMSSANDAKASMSTWTDKIEPLQDAESTGDMTEQQVEQLAYIFNRKRTVAVKIDGCVDELKILQQQVEQLKNATPPEAISTAEVERVRELSQALASADTEWSTSVEQAQAVLRQSSAEPIDQTETLREQVSQAKDRETLAALDRERENGPEKPMASTDVQIETFDSNRDLREQALSLEVASVLAPFLEPRSIQPSLAGSFSIKFNATFDEGPMSLGKIRSIGALDESVIGLKKLALLGGNRKLPEPRWSVASQPGNWSEGDQEFLKKAQRMLIDLGDVLVQEGKLSP